MGKMSIIQMAEEQGALLEIQKANEKRMKQNEKRIREAEKKKHQEQIELAKQQKLYEEQQSMFQTILKHRQIIDLHGYNVQGTRSIVGAKANEVIRSEEMMCIGFIHGIGLHSGPIISDSYDYWNATDEDFEAKLKPNIRGYLDELARKHNNCLSIYGEKMFPIGGYRSEADEIADRLCSGITYFMNLSFYNYYYNEYNYYWTKDNILQFQKVTYLDWQTVIDKRQGR